MSPWVLAGATSLLEQPRPKCDLYETRCFVDTFMAAFRNIQHKSVHPSYCESIAQFHSPWYLHRKYFQREILSQSRSLLKMYELIVFSHVN